MLSEEQGLITFKFDINNSSKELKGVSYFATDKFEINPAFQCQKIKHPQSKMVMNAILTAMFTGVTLHLEHRQDENSLVQHCVTF